MGLNPHDTEAGCAAEAVPESFADWAVLKRLKLRLGRGVPRTDSPRFW